MVILITAVTMAVEIVAGLWYGSMALLADGLHMGSHVCALSISAFAYIYARRHARDMRFSFGTGKVNSLAGFTGAALLALFALIMAWESMMRLLQPVPIDFNHALAVAMLGLAVNGVCVVVLGHEEAPAFAGDDGQMVRGPLGAADERRATQDRHHDHNLRSAYLHVLADALTSVLAIVALLAGKYFGAVWMDPAMGIIGAVLVARWSVGLVVATSAVLLDRQGPSWMQDMIRERLEVDGDEVVDLHLWAVGPGVYALMISLVSSDPQSPEHYHGRLPPGLGLAHVTLEIWPRSGQAPEREAR